MKEIYMYQIKGTDKKGRRVFLRARGINISDVVTQTNLEDAARLTITRSDEIKMTLYDMQLGDLFCEKTMPAGRVLSACKRKRIRTVGDLYGEFRSEDGEFYINRNRKWTSSIRGIGEICARYIIKKFDELGLKV